MQNPSWFFVIGIRIFTTKIRNAQHFVLRNRRTGTGTIMLGSRKVSFFRCVFSIAVSATDLFAAAAFASLVAPLEIDASESLEDSSLDDSIWRTKSRTPGALGAHAAMAALGSYFFCSAQRSISMKQKPKCQLPSMMQLTTANPN